jgi:hypothetical protein
MVKGKLFQSYTFKYPVFVLPVEAVPEEGNIGIIYNNQGNIMLDFDYLPPSEINDEYKQSEKEKIVSNIIKGLNEEQKKYLILKILSGKPRR